MFIHSCPLVVLACESLHACTICVWRCEHAVFCVEDFYINCHSFIHSFMSFGSFSLLKLTCMHCVYLALWTGNALCGCFLYKLSFIHSFIHSCLLVVLACDSLRVCTVCIWRYEHTRFCVEVLYALYILFHSFMSFGSFSFWKLICMHCVYLALWTCNVLCGRVCVCVCVCVCVRARVHMHACILGLPVGFGCSGDLG